MWVIWTVLSVNCGSRVSITVIFCLPAKKPLRQHDITSQQKRNHSSDERHIGSRSASRYFSCASSHDTPRVSIYPRFQSSHPTKHVNSDWVRVWVYYEFTKGPAPSWLDSSVGRVLHRHRRGHGFESRSSLNYFPGFLFPTVQVAYITTMIMHLQCTC